MEARANKPVKHGFDHRLGGQDPIGGILDVTDGTLDIPDVFKVLIGAGLTLTNPSDGEAEIVASGVGPVQSYSPTLTGSVSNPNLGASSAGIGANYLAFGTATGCLVLVTALVNFRGAGLSAGSGDWRLSLPLTAQTNARPELLSQAAFLTDVGTPPFTRWKNLFVADVQSTYVTFGYVTGDIGTQTVLGSSSLGGSPWTLASGDDFIACFMYLAA